jgi:hypothetical protein
MTIADVIGNANFGSVGNFDSGPDLKLRGTTLSGEALGQKSFAPPYLDPNSSAEMANIGVNYASGSSGIFDETGSFYVSY